jgi:hypothetical protein
VVVDKKKKSIVCTSFCNGKKHDFRLFKESKVRFQAATKTLVDSGYQGIQKMQANSKLPKKKTKKCPLTKADKIENQQISRD